MPDRDVSSLATFLIKAKPPLLSVVMKIFDSQLGDRASASSGVNQDTNNGPVTQTD